MTYRFDPKMGLRETQLPLTYEVTYDPVFVGYLEHTDASVWNQQARLRVARVFGERTRLSMDELFFYSWTRLFENIDDVEATEVDIGLTRYTRNAASVRLHHSLTQRTTGSATVTHELSRFKREDYADWDYLSGSLRLTRILGHRDVLGAGSSVNYRSFDDTEVRLKSGGGSFTFPGTSSSRTLTYHGFLYVNHAFGDDFEITLTAGPAWLQQSQLLRYLGVQEKTTSDRLTWFGTADVVKRWRRGTVSASYTRQETALSSFNQSGVLDALTVLASWVPDAYWQFQLRGSWSRRESGFSGSEERRENVWNSSALVQRRLTRRSSLRLFFGYHKQQVTLGSEVSRYEDYSVRLGFGYDFSAIRF